MSERREEAYKYAAKRRINKAEHNKYVLSERSGIINYAPTKSVCSYQTHVNICEFGIRECGYYPTSSGQLVTVIPRSDAESSTKSIRKIRLSSLDSASERGMTVTNRLFEIQNHINYLISKKDYSYIELTFYMCCREYSFYLFTFSPFHLSTLSLFHPFTLSLFPVRKRVRPFGL